MAYWHELTRIRLRFVWYSVSNNARQIVRRNEQSPELFEAFYERKVDAENASYPENWIELWPWEPILAATVEEARNRAQILLEAVASREQDTLFAQRPCPVPLVRKKIRQVFHPTHRASASIFKQEENRYEVRYFGDIVGCDQEEDWRLEVPLIEGRKRKPGFEILTFADSLESAEEIALIELARLVLEGEPIKPR